MKHSCCSVRRGGAAKTVPQQRHTKMFDIPGCFLWTTVYIKAREEAIHPMGLNHHRINYLQGRVTSCLCDYTRRSTKQTFMPEVYLFIWLSISNWPLQARFAGSFPSLSIPGVLSSLESRERRVASGTNNLSVWELCKKLKPHPSVLNINCD